MSILARTASLFLVGLLLAIPAAANDIANPSWTQNDSGNNAASPNGWTSGTMTPNQVEPTARAMMGGIKRWYAHANPTITSGGAANVQTLTYATAPDAYRAGDTYTFIAGFTNTGAMTINVLPLGAKAVQQSGGALTGAEFVAGRVVSISYDGAAFQITNRHLPTAAVDWRDFGCSAAASDNQSCAQAAINAGYNFSLPVMLCGPGSFVIQGPVYHYNHSEIIQCPGTVLKMGGAGGFAILAPATVPGDTYPTAGRYNVRLRYITCDLNFLAGTCIHLQATEDSIIDAPTVYKIAPTGTWTWVDVEGTGTLPNAGIVWSGGRYLNVENVLLLNAHIGVEATGGTYADCPYLGGVGLAMTVPTQDKNLVNPPNGNTISNSTFWCNTVGILNEFGSHNRFIQNDVTWSGEYGMTIGGYKHVDYAVTGTTSAGGNDICIKFATTSLTGSPISKCHTTSAGETPANVASDLVSKINGTAALTGSIFAIGATQTDVAGGEESVIRLAWTEQFTLGVGINFQVTSADNLSISWAHNVSNNYISQMQGEGIRYAMFYVGASALSTTLDNSGQMTNTPHLVSAVYGGLFGTQNLQVTNWFYNQQQHGTTVAGDFVADPYNDPQPYLVNSCSLQIDITMHGLLPHGTVGEFLDAAECFGLHAVKFRAPSSAYGTTNAIKIMGDTTSATITGGAGGGCKLMNSGGDWIGCRPITVTIP